MANLNRDQTFQAFQDHMKTEIEHIGADLAQSFQNSMQREMERAADRFWRDFDRRCKRAAPRQTRKQSHPPGPGYCCNICGMEGGQPDSHWIQFCPDKNKSKSDDTASSTAATIAESENEPQHHCSSPRSLPDFTDQPPEEEEEFERPNSR